VTGDDPHGALPDGFLDLYKLTVELADRVTSRRGTASSFFLAINSALAAFAGSRPRHPSWVVRAAGLLLAAAWWLLLRSYRDLNSAKFSVIREMETCLPVQPFDAEWKYLKKDALPWWKGRYAEQGTVERVVPLVFGALQLMILLGWAAQ
jgi:hypothetical protein